MRKMRLTSNSFNKIPGKKIRIMDGNVFDAIVVGSGISGGWAAKELCEKGLKTIMLERGQNIEHVTRRRGNSSIAANARCN